MSKSRLYSLIGIILIAALSRLLPHAPNVTPVAAMALFGGAYCSDRRSGLLAVFGAMLLADCFIGFHETMPFVYLALGLTVLLGSLLKGRLGMLSLAGATVTSSTLFFLVTNFGVWFSQSLYPKTLEGIIACYTLALPFFLNTILGDLFFTSLIFGSFYLLEKSFGALRTQQALPSS